MRVRPRAPRAEKTTGPLDGATSGGEGHPDVAAPAPDATAAAEAVVITLSGKKPNRASRTAKRAQRKQADAAAAFTGAEHDPALGALNRHLNMMMQQLGTAHRVIGQIEAERDTLRHRLAELQGIPVEHIVVTSLGASLDQPASPAKSARPQPESRISQLNYFGGDDIAVMRKRRQGLVVGVFVLLVMFWWIGRMGYWVLPDKLSRDSLTHVPLIGDFMTYFFAGWLFFRFFRVTSKGVKWIFPSEDSRRRRR